MEDNSTREEIVAASIEICERVGDTAPASTASQSRALELLSLAAANLRPYDYTHGQNFEHAYSGISAVAAQIVLDYTTSYADDFGEHLKNCGFIGKALVEKEKEMNEKGNEEMVIKKEDTQPIKMEEEAMPVEESPEGAEELKIVKAKWNRQRTVLYACRALLKGKKADIDILIVRAEKLQAKYGVKINRKETLAVFKIVLTFLRELNAMGLSIVDS